MLWGRGWFEDSANIQILRKKEPVLRSILSRCYNMTKPCRTRTWLATPIGRRWSTSSMPSARVWLEAHTQSSWHGEVPVYLPSPASLRRRACDPKRDGQNVTEIQKLKPFPRISSARSFETRQLQVGYHHQNVGRVERVTNHTSSTFFSAVTTPYRQGLRQTAWRLPLRVCP